jgi:hypothetical protein
VQLVKYNSGNQKWNHNREPNHNAILMASYKNTSRFIESFGKRRRHFSLQYVFEPVDTHCYKLIPSRASSSRFRFNPPEKPPIFPFAARTRWHGTKTGMGFAPHAPPAARTAFGLPMARAISP